MKRNVNLQELSRDHHHGLLLSWKIREGIKRDAELRVIREYAEYFFAEALLPHFREEEELILGYLSDRDKLKIQTIREHQEIEQLVARLSEPHSIQTTLLEIARVLENHIRFEERTLFPYIEQYLNESELAEIGETIKEDHSIFKDTYPFQFWKYDN
ncbi:hemerythrin domain-containing protein [Desertivirga brevis]|uniref:hemerythrin domain-containing protein n=1 Tax=Desertivirga brevis TaxID=2810310 RepID=UPI001A97B3DC|nr:hemerythrin domain-containing protein [Pedobacter sp. SYSU D00873]